MKGRFQANLLTPKQLENIKDLKHHHLRPEDLKYIKDSFKMNDTNKTSQLNIDELREALNKYGIEIEED